jgi:hypothetical protein
LGGLLLYDEMAARVGTTLAATEAAAHGRARLRHGA